MIVSQIRGDLGKILLNRLNRQNEKKPKIPKEKRCIEDGGIIEVV